MSAGGIEVGNVFTRLGFHVDDDQASRYDRLVDRLRSSSRNDITQDVRVDADTSELDRYNRRVRDVDRSNNDLVHGTTRVRGAMGSLMIGGAGLAAVGLGFGLVAKGVLDATKGYQEHLKVVGQTEAVIKSTGGTANLTAKEVTGLSDALERKTTVDGDVIQQGANMLLTFTNVRNEVGKGNDVFDQATATALDMSVALGQDTKNSALQLGKALNDPIKGVGALSRVGVTFTKGQKEQIKTLVESGRTLDAQKIILKELGKEFGGSAEKAATSTGKLTVAFNQVKDSVGAAVLPYLNRGADALRKFIDGMQDGSGVGGRFSTAMRRTGGVIRDVFGAAISFARGLVRGFGQIIDDNRDTLTSMGRSAQSLARTIGRAFSAIVAVFRDTFGSSSGTGKDVRSIIGRLLDLISIVLKVEAAIVKRALPGIITAFRGLAQIIRGVIKVIAGVLTLDFTKAWDGVKDIFSGATKAIGGIMRAATAPLREAAAAVGKAIGGAFSSAWDKVVQTATGFVNRIIDVINIIPGVDIGHVGGGGSRGGGGGVAGAVTRAAPRAAVHATGDNATDPPGFAAGGFFARTGGYMDRPVALGGEEAPTHAEWVIPENPAYRGRAVALWQAAAKSLGIPGFALGGLFDPEKAADFVKSLPGKAIKSAKGIIGSLTGKLPGNPGGILAGTFDYVKDKALDFIGDKASALWNAAKDVIGGKGVGGMTSFANRLEGMRIPYGPQGHSGWPINRAGEDCSSSVSKVLHGGGVALPGVQTTVTMPSVGVMKRGAGKNVTVYNRALAGNSGHMIMSIKGRFFGTSRSNPGGGPGWLGAQSAGYLATLPMRLHPEGYATGGELLPGGARGYKTGGKTKKKAPAPILTSTANRGITRSVGRGERGISGFETSIRDLEREYGQMDRRFGLSDEVFLIEHDDGSVTVDTAAVGQRTKELDGLIAQREAIKKKLEEYRKAIGALITAIKTAIGKLRSALGKAKGKARQKERGGYRAAIQTYEDRLAELRETHGDLGFDIEDSNIDLAELRGERADVASSTGKPAPPADPDTGGGGGSDDGGGSGDPPPPDDGPTIAEQVAAQLAAFGSAREQLFADFGSNAVQRGDALFPGATGLAAGTQYFGAAGAPRAYAAPGGRVTLIENATFENHFPTTPPSGGTYVDQQARRLDLAFS